MITHGILMLDFFPLKGMTWVQDTKYNIPNESSVFSHYIIIINTLFRRKVSWRFFFVW